MKYIIQSGISTATMSFWALPRWSSSIVNIKSVRFSVGVELESEEKCEEGNEAEGSSTEKDVYWEVITKRSYAVREKMILLNRQDTALERERKKILSHWTPEIKREPQGARGAHLRRGFRWGPPARPKPRPLPTGPSLPPATQGTQRGNSQKSKWVKRAIRRERKGQGWKGHLEEEDRKQIVKIRKIEMNFFFFLPVEWDSE